MKFSFFFLFGAIKFVLAEGGSACGCGRVCVKKQKVTCAKLSGRKASVFWKLSRSICGKNYSWWVFYHLEVKGYTLSNPWQEQLTLSGFKSSFQDWERACPVKADGSKDGPRLQDVSVEKPLYLCPDSGPALTIWQACKTQASFPLPSHSHAVREFCFLTEGVSSWLIMSAERNNQSMFCPASLYCKCSDRVTWASRAWL